MFIVLVWIIEYLSYRNPAVGISLVGQVGMGGGALWVMVVRDLFTILFKF